MRKLYFIHFSVALAGDNYKEIMERISEGCGYKSTEDAGSVFAVSVLDAKSLHEKIFGESDLEGIVIELNGSYWYRLKGRIYNWMEEKKIELKKEHSQN